MIVYLATLYTPDGQERYLTTEGKLTTCEACATRFIDPVTAETAATRAIGEGWAFEIEEMEL